MADQLLWLETLLKGSIGLVMLLVPLSAAKLAGLPHATTSFWPRLFGAALLGIAAACALEGYTQLNPRITAGGLGLGGIIVINVIALLSLIGTMIFKSVSTFRGKALIWLISALLVALILLEIAQI